MRFSPWLQRWWPWIVFPAAFIAANTVFFVFVGGEEGPQIATIEVGSGPQYVVAGDEGVWVSGFAEVGVTEIDPETNAVDGDSIGTITPGHMAQTGGYLWVGSIGATLVTRIDAATHEIVDEITVGETPQNLAAGLGYVWAAVLEGPVQGKGFVARLDPETGEVTGRFSTGHRFPTGITTGFGFVWVVDIRDNVLVQLTPDGEIVREVDVGESPIGVVTGAGSVWVSHFGDGTVHRIDPDTGEVIVRKPIVIGQGLAGIAFGEGSLWVTSPSEDVVVQISPEDNEVVERYRVGDSPQGVAVGLGSVWVVNQEDETVSRLRL